MNEIHQNLYQTIKENFPLFEENLIQQIITVGNIETIEPDNKLIEPGNYIKHFPLLTYGLVEVYRDDLNGNEILLYFLKPGEACSAMLSCCIAQQKSEIHARTVEESTILKIPIQYIDKWLFEFPTWKNFIFNLYRLRFNELLDTVDSLAFLKMDERLIRFFKNLYVLSGKHVYEGSHFEIAQSLNSSREVVSRLLKALENKQKVTIYRNKVNFSGLVDCDFKM